MGAQMTKELGVYNEEEKISTPLGPQRYRLLTPLNDPRSATVGIVRTPIRVECTPTGVKTACRTESISKAGECTPTGIKTACGTESISKMGECTPTRIKTACETEENASNMGECTPIGIKAACGTESVSKVGECTPTEIKTACEIESVSEMEECSPIGIKAACGAESVSKTEECTPTGIKTACGTEESASNMGECTPIGIKTACGTDSISEMECSFTDTNKVDKENSVSSKDGAITEKSDTSSENNFSEHEPKYLETDIDKIDSPAQTVVDVSENKEKQPVSFPEFKSPIFGMGHTPVLVECTPELFALHSRIDSLSFCDFDVHAEDPSVIVSDDDQTSTHNQSSVKNWLITIEDNASVDPPCNDSFTDSPRQVAKKQKEFNAMKKKLFFTPDVNLIAKPKARTPLGDLQAGTTPQKVLQTKQWRNIQEERQRRGLLDTENTPPNLPPLAMVSSAPGKILNRKRSKANWDEDNALLI